MTDVQENLKLETTDGKKISPKQVLFDEMDFYRTKANKLGNEIARIIKNGDKNRGDLLFQLYKLMLANKEHLVEIAAKLAPYEHARLQSVEVKSQVEHRYVIRVPQVMQSTDEWFKSNKIEQKEPIYANVKIDTTDKAIEAQAREIEDITDYELVVSASKQSKTTKNKDVMLDDDDDDDIIDRFDS